LEKISYGLKAEALLSPKNEKALYSFTQVTQRAYNLDAVEIYSAKAQRLTLSISPKIIHVPLPAVSANDLQKDIHPKGVRSISAINESGELFRTIGTVPFGIKPTEAEAYVVLTNVIPTELSESMASISRGFE